MSLTKVSYSMINGAVANVLDYGAVGDGITDDTNAIKAAINAADVIYFPEGDYRLTSKIEFTQAIEKKLIGVGVNQSRLLCYEITGYTFEFNCPVNTFSIFEIDGLTITGLQNGSDNWEQGSTTWLGMIYNTNSAIVSGHLVRKLNISNCSIRGSNSINAIGVNLKGIFFAETINTYITFFPYGYGVYAGVANNVSTTLSFTKCYIHFCQECFCSSANVSDIQFYDTVFESSVVAISAFSTKLLVSGCYFENMGYSIDGWSTVTSGKSLKNFGISFGAGILDTPVISAINLAYCEVLFQSCNISYRSANYSSTIQPNSRWLYMMGRGSTLGVSGGARFENCVVDQLNANSFLEFVTDAVQEFTSDNGCAFEWVQGSRLYFLSYSDIRNIRDGSLYIEFPVVGSNPNSALQCDVKRGRLIVNNSSFTTPTNSPVGGSWVIGDIIYTNSPTAAGSIGSVCVTSGTPGTWKTFGTISA